MVKNALRSWSAVPGFVAAFACVSSVGAGGPLVTVESFSRSTNGAVGVPACELVPVFASSGDTFAPIPSGEGHLFGIDFVNGPFNPPECQCGESSREFVTYGDINANQFIWRIDTVDSASWTLQVFAKNVTSASTCSGEACAQTASDYDWELSFSVGSFVDLAFDRYLRASIFTGASGLTSEAISVVRLSGPGGLIVERSIHLTEPGPAEVIDEAGTIRLAPGVYTLACEGTAGMLSSQSAPCGEQASGGGAVTSEFGVTLDFTPACPGDLDGSGGVDSTDLNILLSDFGCSGGGCAGDTDLDGDTDSSDLNILLSQFGVFCESPG